MRGSWLSLSVEVFPRRKDKNFFLNKTKLSAKKTPVLSVITPKKAIACFCPSRILASYYYSYKPLWGVNSAAKVGKKSSYNNI